MAAFRYYFMKKQTKQTQHTDHEKLPRVIDNVRAKCNEELTDVVAGPMTLNELTSEIANQSIHRSPEYMIILIEKRPELGKYHSTLYITLEDFGNYRKNAHSNKFKMEVKK